MLSLRVDSHPALSLAPLPEGSATHVPSSKPSVADTDLLHNFGPDFGGNC